MKSFLCLGLAAALLAIPLSVRAQTAPTYSFDIPAGLLSDALTTFQTVTGRTVDVAGAARVDGLATQGASGQLTAEEALRQLLAGTGLTFQLTSAGTFVLRVAVAGELVEVTGRLGAAPIVATRTPTPLRDVPQAITVVSDRLIADLQMQSLADVTRYIPGVQMAQGEGNRDTVVFRGNSSTADFYVDGMRDDVQFFRDLYNVEQVEGLKGPNAMIFGRGGAGGVINRTTRKAHWTTERSATLTLGSYENRRATLDLNQRVNDAMGARVTGVYENSDTYRDGVNIERYGVNPTVAFSLGANTVLRAGYEYFHDERVADRGVPSRNGGPVAADPSVFFGDPSRSPTHATVNAFSMALDRRVSDTITLRQRARLAHYDKFYQNVFPNRAVGDDGLVSLGAYNNATERLNVFSQTDLDLALRTGAVGHRLLIGGELGRQDTSNFRNTGYFAALGPDVTSFVTTLDAPTISSPVVFRQSATDADNDIDATVAAIYVQDQIEWTPYLQTITGVRYERFAVSALNNRTQLELSSVDHLVSPRLGVVVRPVEPVSLYGSYSIGYVPRAGDQLSSLSVTTQSLDPERFNNYEVGAKWDVHPALSLTAALYRLDRTNVVVPDPVDPTRSMLVDGQRTIGVELEATGRLTDKWTVVAGYAHQDAKITETLSGSALAGAVLPHVPENSLSLWNRYDVTPRVGVGLGIIHTDRIFASTDNTVSLPSWTRVDAGVFTKLTERLGLQLNVENLFDESYFASAHNNNNITPGSPRSLRVALTTSF